MAEFLALLPTLIVVALIAAAVCFSVRLIRRKGSGCGGSCGSCKARGGCERKKK